MAAVPKVSGTGYVQNVVIGDEKDQRDYYNAASHYDTLWGLDNIHLGYYPHLVDKTQVPLSFQQAGSALTRHMCKVAQIDHTSKVLDLGCGKGLACKEIAELTGAACTGMDLAEANVERGNEIAKQNPHLKLDFCVGSFTELPQQLLDREFTHIFSQVAFCHVHKLLPVTMQELKKLLKKGAVAIVNDYIGTDDPVLEDTREHVHKRLHFEMLCSHKQWRHHAEDAGIQIMYYENIDAHIEQSYRHLAQEAAKYSFKSADGMPIVDNYRKTVEVAEKRQIGMNVAILRA